MSDQRTVVAAYRQDYQVAEERVTLEAAIATLRERERTERDLLAKTVEAGRVLYVTKHMRIAEFARDLEYMAAPTLPINPPKGD